MTDTSNNHKPTKSSKISTKQTQTNITLLTMYTIFYLLPLMFTSSNLIRNWSICLFIIILIIGIICNKNNLSKPRNATPKQRLWVIITSQIEGIATIIGLLLGLIANWWQIFGILITISVTLHFIALAIAYKRLIDVLAILCAFITASICILSPFSTIIDNWCIAGGILAGCTATYAIHLQHQLHQNKKSQNLDQNSQNHTNNTIKH